MPNAIKRQHLTCFKCKKRVFDKTIIKHMWESHRAHMMKNRNGGREKAPLVDRKQNNPIVRSAVVPPKGEYRHVPYVPYAEHLSYDELVKLTKSNGSKTSRPKTRLEYSSREGRTLTVIICQGQSALEIPNVTLIKVLE